ncbi:MAG: hypothetical protein AABP62_14930 [Planctomycetota bacterium]
MEFEQNYAGSKNAAKVPVLPQGMHFNKVQESNYDTGCAMNPTTKLDPQMRHT